MRPSCARASERQAVDQATELLGRLHDQREVARVLALDRPETLERAGEAVGRGERRAQVVAGRARSARESRGGSSDTAASVPFAQQECGYRDPVDATEHLSIMANFTQHTGVSGSDDVQASRPAVHLSLSKAGVTGLHQVIRICHGGDETLYYADIECSVDLDPAQKGVHMSRFAELFAEAIESVVIGDALAIEDLAGNIATRVLERQGALRSYARIEAKFPVSRTTPVSGLQSQEIYTLIGVASATGAGTRRAVGVRVRGLNACPCAQGMVRERASERLADMGYEDEERARILDAIPIATHNQRAEAELLVGSSRFTPAEELIEIAESSMSAPILALLKRPDELYVVEQAHLHPMFVEDSVRAMVQGVIERYPRARGRRARRRPSGELRDDPQPRRRGRAHRAARRAARRGAARRTRRRAPHARRAGSPPDVRLELLALRLGQREHRVEHVREVGAGQVLGRHAAAHAQVVARVRERPDAVEGAGDRAAVLGEQPLEQLLAVVVRHGSQRRVHVEHARLRVVVQVHGDERALDHPVARGQVRVLQAEAPERALDVQVRGLGAVVERIGAAERLEHRLAVAPLEDDRLDRAARAVGVARERRVAAGERARAVVSKCSRARCSSSESRSGFCTRSTSIVSTSWSRSALGRLRTHPRCRSRRPTLRTRRRRSESARRRKRIPEGFPI